MIYFTSDLHFCHDKEFLYKPRGFNSIHDMNRQIIKNWNATVQYSDDIYILGDIMLSNDDVGVALLHQLNGRIHIILGNHDTDNRISLFNNSYNVCSIEYGSRMRYKGHSFVLSHYPCLCTHRLDKALKAAYISLHGHTHSDKLFELEDWYTYNVAVDAHDCTPVSIDQIIEDLHKYYA